MQLSASDLNLVKSFFATKLLLLVLLILGLFLLHFVLGRWFRTEEKLKKPLRLAIIGSCLVIMSFPQGAVHNVIKITQLTTTEENDFETTLRKLAIDPASYTLPENVKATAGKNIIAIAMESFEMAFLSDTLAHLTPNLRKLAKENTLYTMHESPGSNWTSGAIYTFVSGFPAFFKAPQNQAFQQTKQVKITGISHVLKAADYQLDYLLALKQYAGINDMLSAYGFNVHSEGDFEEEYELGQWGMHDKDLFYEAKKRIKTYDRNKPFALFMSTISTHPDDGVYDARMEGIIPPQRSSLEFMAAATDHFVGDLLAFLEKEGLRSNTVIYLFPDHLMMGMAPRVMQDFPPPRSLFLLTNATPEDLQFSPENTLFQIDLPQLMLNGAGVKHNARFLSSYIDNDNKKNFLEQQQPQLLAANQASLRTASYTGGFTIRKSGQTSISIEGKHSKHEVEASNKAPFTFHFEFDENGSLLKSRQQSTYAALASTTGHLELTVEVQQDKLFAYLKKGNQPGIAKHGESQISYTENDIALFNEWQLNDPEFSRPLHPNYFTPFDLIELTSSIPGAIQHRHPPQVKVGSKSFALDTGIHLLYKNKHFFSFEVYDLTEPKQAEKLVKQVEHLQRNKTYFTLLANDFAQGFTANQKDRLKQTGFHILPKLNPNEAFIAYSYCGFVNELWDAQTFSLTLPQEPTIKRSPEVIEKEAQEKERFIAHAGGSIDGHTYTNSLEALNHAYNKGFRLFELDIMETVGGEFVAVHNWEEWKQMTNYQGTFPVHRDTFMSYKLHGKYTPMDMDAINRWFSEHRDAILVTDKINLPNRFVPQFVDRKRLMMELFSIEAIQEAQALDILAVMPSMHVMNGLKGDKIAQLKAMNIEHLTFSRYHLREQYALLKALKAAGIRTYLYNINYEFGKDEAYVLCNELDVAYGMYADKWTFK